MIYPFRKHEEFNKDKPVSTVTDQELETPMEESDFETPELVENYAKDQEAPLLEDDLIFFWELKDELFKDIFAKIMRSKIMHNAAEQCINEIVDVFLEASQQSNVLFQKKLKQAIDIEVEKLESGTLIISSKIILISI